MTAVISTPHLERRPEFAGILRETHEFSQPDARGASASVNGWFDRLVLQSGIDATPPVWLSLCVFCGVSLGGAMWLIAESPLSTALAAVVGLLFPILTAGILRTRRQKQMMEQLPAMAEELARAARSGRSLESAFRLVAADTPSPLGDELKRASRRADMGLDLAGAVSDLPARTGVAALTVFTAAVAVHQETGGDLIQVLDRLATAVRSRLHFTARLRAATIASRLGTALMVLVPVLVVAFYVLRDPTYLSQLTQSFWGRLSLGTALFLQVTGCTIAWQILRRCARF